METHYDVAPLVNFHPETGLLLAALNDSTREWIGELETPSIDAIVWQPWPNSYSIGALLCHIIDVEAYWFETFAANHERDPEELRVLLSEETKQDDGIWPTPPAEPIEWYFEFHKRVRTRSYEAIRNIDPTKVYEGRRASFTLRWIVAHVVEHDSYHGGQAVLIHEMWKKMGLRAL